MVSQLLNSPEYKAVYAAVAEATYWARLGDFVNTPGHANRIIFEGGMLRLAFGANCLNLSRVFAGVRGRVQDLAKIGLSNQDLSQKAKCFSGSRRAVSVLKENLLNQLSGCVENAHREPYSNYPITDDYFVFGATYVHVPTLCRCLLRHLGYPELAENRYWASP